MSVEKANIIRISRGNSLPITFRIVFTLILFLIYIALTGYLPKALVIALMILLAPILPLIWTLQDMIEINMNKKFIHEYIWVLGNKWGAPTSFKHIKYIFINATKMRQAMTSWGGRVRYSQYSEYVAYLKLNSGKKFLLTRSKNYDSLAQELRTISVKLDTTLKDTTQ
ncbi:hypothetical protein N8287_00330 [bacterium]|jgi:hypothetical protein|nr:hypothetical protein [bacterium]|tara:strand:+ start:3652 stop:4155 length:504 start_codon:yes stop_codon:yes gene_type:complete